MPRAWYAENHPRGVHHHAGSGRAELEVLADGRSEALDVAIGKINKAEAELAKVTVELDEARRMAEIRLRAIESIRHASLRATPTEGE